MNRKLAGFALTWTIYVKSYEWDAHTITWHYNYHGIIITKGVIIMPSYWVCFPFVSFDKNCASNIEAGNPDGNDSLETIQSRFYPGSLVPCFQNRLEFSSGTGWHKVLQAGRRLARTNRIFEDQGALSRSEAVVIPQSSVLSPQSSVLSPQSSVLNLQSPVLNSRPSVHIPRSSILDS